MTASCKLQLAAGLRAFSKDIYLPGRQIRFMFWFLFFFKEKKSHPVSPKINISVMQPPGGQTRGAGSGCSPCPFCPSPAAQTPSHDPKDPSRILWHPAWAQDHPTQQKGLGRAGETPCYKYQGTVGTKLLVLIQGKRKPDRVRNVPIGTGCSLSALGQSFSSTPWSWGLSQGKRENQKESPGPHVIKRCGLRIKEAENQSPRMRE